MKDKKKSSGGHKCKASSQVGDGDAGPSSNHDIQAPNGEPGTSAFDKFAFTDEDDEQSELQPGKKPALLAHRSSERARRGKISQGIQRLWSLIPVENKGNNSKETLVGILDRVASYITLTQQKLEDLYQGQGQRVRDAEVELLHKKIAELTEQNQTYVEALKMSGDVDFLTSQAQALASLKSQKTVFPDVIEVKEDKTTKKVNRSTVGEHLKRREKNSNEKVTAAANTLLGMSAMTGQPITLPLNGQLPGLPLPSNISGLSAAANISASIASAAGGIQQPATPGSVITTTTVDGKTVVVNAKSMSAGVPSMSGSPATSTQGPALPGQPPMVNMPVVSTQSGVQGLQVPGMGQLQGNLVLGQNGQLILMNDLTSAAMAAAGITGNMLGTPTGPADSPVVVTEEKQSPTPASEPPQTSSPGVIQPSAVMPVSDTNTSSSGSLAGPVVSSLTTTMSGTSVAMSSTAPLTPQTLTMPPGASLPQLQPQPPQTQTSLAPPPIMLPPGITAANLQAMNNPTTTVSTAPIGLTGHPQPVLLPGQNPGLSLIGSQPQPPLPGISFMTPQGQLVTVPQQVQPSTPAPAPNNVMQLNPSTPSQFPSALLLPNGQIVPVVTQPSLLFPQGGGVGQPAMSTNTTVVASKPAGQMTSNSPFGSGLLMTTNAGAAKINASNISTLSSSFTGLKTTTTSGLQPPASVLGPMPNVTMSTGVSTQAVTSGTSVTYSHGQVSKTVIPGPSPLNLLPTTMNSQIMMPPIIKTESQSLPHVGVSTVTSGMITQSGAVLNKSVPIAGQAGPLAQTVTSVAVSSSASGTITTTSGVGTGGGFAKPGVLTTPTSTGVPTTTAASLSSLPSTMTAVVSADGSIVLTLPPGPQPGNFMLDPNTIPSILPGLSASGSQVSGLMPGSVKKGKKSGQRMLMPKPVVQSTVGAVTPSPAQTWVTGPPPLLVQSAQETKTTTKVSNPSSSAAPDKATTPLSIITSESTKPPGKPSPAISSSSSANDILAQAAKSIFSMSPSDISPPISSFYNPANEDNPLQIDTSAAETQSDENEASQISISKPPVSIKSKKASNPVKKSKSKKKIENKELQEKGKPDKKMESKASNIVQPIIAAAPQLESPNPTGPSPLHNTFGDDHDGMVIDLQHETLQSPTQEVQHSNEESSTSHPQAGTEVEATFVKETAKKDISKGVESPRPDEPSLAQTQFFTDVLQSSMMASGITMTGSDTPDPPPAEDNQVSDSMPFLLPDVVEVKTAETPEKRKSKDKSSKKSKNKHKKSKHHRQESKESMPEELVILPEPLTIDTGNVSIESEKMKSPTLNPIEKLQSPTINAIDKLQSPTQNPVTKVKKKSPKKHASVQAADIIPETITFSESEIADVLDQVESLGEKLNPSKKDSSNRKHKKSISEDEPQSKRKKTAPSSNLETENSDSLTTTDLLERAMKDIGPLDMELSEPDSLSEPPMFGLNSSEVKNKEPAKTVTTSHLEASPPTSDPEPLELSIVEPIKKPNCLLDLSSTQLDSPPPSNSPVPGKSLLSSPTPPSSPGRSILDSISSISSMVATSSATLTASSTQSLSTQASTIATTTDTFSHRDLLSTPVLTPASSPLRMSCSTSVGSISPPSITVNESKPPARHTNLIPLAQSLAPPTPKSSTSISHKQLATSASSTNSSNFQKNSLQPSVSSAPSSSHGMFVPTPTTTVSYRPHISAVPSPSQELAPVARKPANTECESTKQSSKKNTLANSTSANVESEKRLSININLDQPNVRPDPSPHLSDHSPASSPINSSLGIPGPTMPLMHLNATNNAPTLSASQNTLQSSVKLQPNPPALNRTSSHDNKVMNSPVVSPAGSFASPVHSNYSAELLFSPASSSTASKSPMDSVSAAQVQSNLHNQNQSVRSNHDNVKSSESRSHTHHESRNSNVSNRPPHRAQQQQQHQTQQPQQQLQQTQQQQQPRIQQTRPQQQQQSRPQQSQQSQPHSQPQPQSQPPQPQSQRSTFYSAENMVSKSSGISHSKSASCSQNTAHPQDHFALTMLGCQHEGRAGGSPHRPHPPNPSFLAPFSLAPSTMGAFSFSLSSTTSTTPTPSGRGQFDGPTSFYPIPGMSNSHPPQPGLPHGSGMAPHMPSQISPIFMPHGHGSSGNSQPPNPINQSHRHSSSHAASVPGSGQAIVTSSQSGAGQNHHRGHHFGNFPTNPSAVQPHPGSRELNHFGSEQPTLGISGPHDKGPQSQQSNNSSNSMQTPSIHSSNPNPMNNSNQGPGRTNRSDAPFYATPNFQPPVAPPGGSATNTNQMTPLHHPPRPGTGPSPGPHRPGFDSNNLNVPSFPGMHQPNFNSASFEPPSIHFNPRPGPANQPSGPSQGSAFPHHANDSTRMTKQNSRPNVESSQHNHQQPQQQQQPQPPPPQSHRSSKSVSGGSGSGSTSKSSSSKSSRSKQKKLSNSNRCEVDTNLSNSIFETGRSMTPLFSTMSPPSSRQLPDGPTYITQNLFSNAPRPLSSTNPLQHKNSDINPSFPALFQRPRPQNGLGLNFQPGFGMNPVHGTPHVTAAAAQMITPHSNSGSVVSHMPNFNLSNIFPDVNNSAGGGSGGQGPDTLNMSPIKFAAAHGNALLAPPSGPAPPSGLEGNPALQHHPPGGAQIYHQHRGHHQMAPPQVLHNAMTINSLLSHNHHGFDPRQVAPPINSSMATPFGSHPHHASFGISPLNFPIHEH